MTIIDALTEMQMGGVARIYRAGQNWGIWHHDDDTWENIQRCTVALEAGDLMATDWQVSRKK